MLEKQAFRYFDLSVFLHFLGRLLYATFIPILLLKNGFSLTAVLTYFLIQPLITILITFFSTKLLHKKNIIEFNIFAIITEIALVILFSLNSISWKLLTIFTILNASYYSLYYISYNSIIAHYSSLKLTGNNLGNLQILGQISSLLSPIIGALILENSKTTLIITSSILLFLSVLPLLKISKDDIEGQNSKKINFKNILLPLANHSLSTLTEIIIFTYWALFLYLEQINLVMIGIVSSTMSFAIILLSFLIKKKLYIESFRKSTEFIAMMGIAFISLIRYFYPEQIILTNILISLFFAALHLTTSTLLFEKVKGYQTYYSAKLINIAGMSLWPIGAILVMIIGLKNIILAPILILIIYIGINIKELRKHIIWKKEKTLFS